MRERSRLAAVPPLASFAMRCPTTALAPAPSLGALPKNPRPPSPSLPHGLLPVPCKPALRTAMAAPARPAHGTIESARRERLGLRVQPDSSREHRPGEGNEQKWRRPNQTRIASTAIQMLLLDGLEDLGE